MSGRLISPKILGLNARNLGLFWAVPRQIFGLLLVHMCFLCVKLWLECLRPKWP